MNRLAKLEPPQSSHPITDKAKMDNLRGDYCTFVAKKLKDNPNLQFPELKNDYGVQKLIRGSGLLEKKQPKDSTLQKWLRETRKKVKAKSKRVARKKTK